MMIMTQNTRYDGRGSGRGDLVSGQVCGWGRRGLCLLYCSHLGREKVACFNIPRREIQEGI